MGLRSSEVWWCGFKSVVRFLQSAMSQEKQKSDPKTEKGDK